MCNLPDNFQPELHALLVSIGLSRRERSAEWAKVPTALRQAVPEAVAVAMSQGNFPASGFGLGADIGAGKSMALAAMVKGMVHAVLRRNLEKGMDPWVPQGRNAILWISWADESAFFRAHATSEAVERKILAACTVPLLILDDLGRERIKGAYTEDWVINQLDRIITSRNREALPTLWTTNVQAPAMVDLYGGAFVDRLLQDNPMTWVPGLKSLRLS